MSITFTTTISPEILQWLKNKAKQDKKTICAILEESVSLYRIEEKRQQLKETFQRANRDPKMLAMAEESLQDSNEQFISFQQA